MKYYKIIKCTEASMWYKNLVGSVFIQLEHRQIGVKGVGLSHFYKSVDPHWKDYTYNSSNLLLFIRKEDCIPYTFRKEKLNKILCIK